MNEVAEIVFYSFFSGVTVFIGGVIARVFEKFRPGVIKDYIVHAAIAFGGGVLVAAVGFVLTPKGINAFSILTFSLVFSAGAFAFFRLDRFIERHGGVAAQLLTMMMDYVPEAIALGAVFAHDSRLGLLLALFIGLQNLPEAFNAYSDLRKSGYTPNKILLVFFPLSFSGVCAALLGRYLLTGSPGLVAGLMLFAAGGILYLVFQDIAPLAKMEKHWAPALGATFGFLVGSVNLRVTSKFTLPKPK